LVVVGGRLLKLADLFLQRADSIVAVGIAPKGLPFRPRSGVEVKDRGQEWVMAKFCASGTGGGT